MTSRVIESAADRDSFVALMTAKKRPFTVTVTDGRKRSVEQNRLQRMWMNEAAEQLGEYTAEEYRAYCKLVYGVPILRAEDDAFCEDYDELIRPLLYPQKIKMMSVPLDFGVTRKMTVKQKKQYLDDVYHHFSSLGVQLTEPK